MFHIHTRFQTLLRVIRKAIKEGQESEGGQAETERERMDRSSSQVTGAIIHWPVEVR